MTSIWPCQAYPWQRLGAVLVLPCVAALAAPAAEVVRFAPEKDYAPFVFETVDGSIRGLSVDMLDALRPMLAVSIRTQRAQPLAQILAAAQRGEVDLISSLRPTPERSAYLAFTAPYVQVPAVLVVRQSISPAHLSDMAGQRVAVGQGYAVEAYARRNYPLVRWQAVPDDLTALRGLMQGHYQGVVADIASVTYAIREQQVRGVQVVEAIGFDYPLSFAYRKELTRFGKQLQTALQRLEPQRRERIVDRWIASEALQYEDRRRTVLRRGALVLGLVAAALLLGGYWHRRQGRAG